MMLYVDILQHDHVVKTKSFYYANMFYNKVNICLLDLNSFFENINNIYFVILIITIVVKAFFDQIKKSN